MRFRSGFLPPCPVAVGRPAHGLVGVIVRRQRVWVRDQGPGGSHLLRSAVLAGRSALDWTRRQYRGATTGVFQRTMGVSSEQRDPTLSCVGPTSLGPQCDHKSPILWAGLHNGGGVALKQACEKVWREKFGRKGVHRSLDLDGHSARPLLLLLDHCSAVTPHRLQ